MPTNRSAILSNLQSTLQSITIANDYKTNVARVEIVPRGWTWTQVSTGDRPFIGIMTGRVVPQVQPAMTIYETMPFRLMCFVQASSGALKTTAIDNLEDDITAALYADQSRGGAAYMTTISDIDRDDISDQTQGFLTMTVDVKFYRTTTLTTA
jgi:hypothetical protein